MRPLSAHTLRRLLLRPTRRFCIVRGSLESVSQITYYPYVTYYGVKRVVMFEEWSE